MRSPLLALGLGAVMMAGCSPSQSAAIKARPTVHQGVVNPTPDAAKPHRWPGLQPPPGFPWLPLPGSPYLASATIDGGEMTLLWLDQSHLKFRYVPGSKYPEFSPRSAADENPNSWMPDMVAAFNGAFKLADHAGGYYYLGHTVSPLLPGYATIVVYKDGFMRLGKWGRDLHLGSNMLMVRENLPPFIDHGVPQPKSTDTYRTWGFTFNYRWFVNRSALGQLADGALVFAYGHNVQPSTMADALAKAGSRFAVNLDMNGYYPAGFLYRHMGPRVLGSRLNTNVIHSPNVYFQVYLKDFFVVEPR